MGNHYSITNEAYELKKPMPGHYPGAKFERVSVDSFLCVNGNRGHEIPAWMIQDEEFFKKINNCPHEYVCTKCGKEKE